MTGLRQGGVYLITGGAGGLGLIFARYLAERVGARLVLVGRRAPGGEAAELARLGGQVDYIRADVTRPAMARRVVKIVRRRYGALHGVIHSAGVLADALLPNKTPEAFARVLDPKLRGALVLDHATRNEPLDFFVLFSSIVSRSGNPGQTDYASANRFLDAFARLRAGWVRENRRHGASLSIAWPLWEEGGMRLGETEAALLRNNLGLVPLPTADALAAFEAVLARAGGGESAELMVTYGDTRRIDEVLGVQPTNLKEIDPSRAVPESAPSTQSRIEAAADVPDLRPDLRRIIADLLKVAEADIEADVPLGEYGFDSVSFTRFANAINDRFRTRLTPAVFFEYDTLDGLAGHLAGEVTPSPLNREHTDAQQESTEAVRNPVANTGPSREEVPDSTPPAPVQEAIQPDHGAEPIAVIGLSGRFPGADDPDALWERLCSGANLLGEVPPERWDWRAIHGDPLVEPNRTRVRSGGFCRDIAAFDAAFFGISPKEAAQIDPQHRVFLETVWHALENAGYRPGALRGSRTGVFAGVSTSDYRELLEQHGQTIEAHTPTGTLHAMLTNRVSFLLDLRGPSESIDTACSSSLVAVHRAIQALRRGECELALAGGVNALLSPRLFIAFDRAGMLAPDGRCKTFDRRADGYVRGEGAGVVVLKPLHRALADGDHIHGVLRSSAVNHGGQAQSLTAPNARAQAELLVEAIGAAGVDPETIGYIEVHGTGTALGDPIEVNGLKKAFAEMAALRGRPSPSKAFCGLGSIKTHIGHLETAAGVVGLIHTLLALRHRRLPALHDFRELNPHIDLAGSPFFIVDQARDWSEPHDSQGRVAPRRAGVSSFGFGGVNAHCVVEEAQAASSRPTEGPVLVPLSARTPEQLQTVTRRLLDYLATAAGREASLADISYTLQVGRENHEHRLAIVCENPAELVEKLAAVLADAREMPGIWRGVAAGRAALAGFGGDAEDRDYLRALVAKGKLARLAAFWVGGVAIAWEDLYASDERHRVPLPGYPFERRRHWFGGDGAQPPIKRETANAAIALPQPCSAPEVPLHGPKPTPVNMPPLGLWQPAWRLVEPDGAHLPAMPHKLVIRHSRDFGLAATLADQGGRIAFLGRGRRKAGERYRSIDQAREADFVALLEAIHEPFDIFFLGGLALSPFDPADLAAFDRAQNSGVMALLNLVRALRATGGVKRVGRLLVVTGDVHRPDRNGVGTNPSAGGLAGLCRVIRGEYPELPLSCIDLDQDELAADSAGIAQRLAEVPCLPAVELALRAGRWWRRVLEPLPAPDTPSAATLPVRPGGVYLIAGGAGGLGLTFSRHLAECAGAQLVWLGRRARDAAVDEAIRAVEAAGGQVLYLRADLCDPTAVVAAVNEAVTRFGAIHGFLHSAVLLHEALMPDQDPAQFRAGLDVKGRGTLALCEALRSQPLDFALFFSSAIAYLGSPGTSGYAAGCSLKDVLANYYAQHSDLPAKIVDWGFWGGVGRAASPHYRKLFEARGIHSIEAAEGIAACSALLSGTRRQVVVGRVEEAHWQFQGLLDTAAPVPVGFAEVVEAAQMVEDGGNLAALSSGLDALEDHAAHLLWAEWNRAGNWPALADEAELRTRFGVAPQKQPWFAATLALLKDSGLLRRLKSGWQIAGAGPPAPAALRSEREALIRRWPALTPYLTLLDHCAEHWNPVLRGERDGVDILFPNGSPALVEPLYRGNPWADVFNRRVAAAVLARARRHRADQPLRILEIGAGTGGTSLLLLESLSSAGLTQLEYIFTDVSQRFTGQASKVFGPRFPFLRCRALDIERPPEDQGYAAASCDVVIAANVLHATRDLAATLRRVRSLLKPGGLLVLNEMTRPQAFLTLSFGLLDGWWLADDPGLRFPHAPLAAPEGWARLLRGLGFPAVTAVSEPGADPTRHARQSVILALAGGAPVLAGASPSSPIDAGAAIAPASPVVPPSTQSASTADNLPAVVLEQIGAVLAELVELDGRTVEPGRPFVEFGVDSLLAVEVVSALNVQLKINLRKTDLFNNPTPGELAAHIAACFGGSINRQPLQKRGGVSAPSSAAKGSEEGDERSGFSSVQSSLPLMGALGSNAANNQIPPHSNPLPGGEETTVLDSNRLSHPGANTCTDIAIIGLSGRFPDADDLDEFWCNLANGHDAVGTVPKDRWDAVALFDSDSGSPDHSYSRWGGFLRDVASFDPLFFNISPHEAELMDPQQRLFLMEAWKAMEDAGYSRRRLEGRRCGVFAGVTQGDYLNLLRAAGRLTDSHGSIGNACAILPARVAYCLNLKGPCLALDTGCSSALVAVHMACRSILSGESELALAGGVSVLNTPDWHLFFCRAGMASPTGRCHTFDDRADGFVPAEGVGVVLLKRLDQALADGDVVHGIIKASGINQDGTSNGITAPNATSQTALLRDVHRLAGITPDTLDYIETHGTGTKLGDPIEFHALQDAFGATARGGKCVIGSVKTNIGHTLAAAGIAGLIKVLLALRHRAMPPSLHFEMPNRHLDFESSPFEVTTALRDWPTPPGRPRRAAVSAFGFSGTNAHLVVEEAPPVPAAHRELGWHWQLVTLSALTEDALMARCADLRSWLGRDGRGAEFEVIIYTLNAGRSNWPVRLALLARNSDDLASRLDAILAGDDADAFRSDGPVPATPDPRWAEQAAARLRTAWTHGAADESRCREALAALGQLYVAGWEPDWDTFYGDFRPRRLPLPTYPFARERCWVDAPASVPPPALGQSRATSPPVTRREGLSERQSTSSAFHGIKNVPTTHPFLEGGKDEGIHYAFCAIFRREDVYFCDHVGGGKVLIPAAAQIEMARAAGEALLGAGKPLHLSNLSWQKPLIAGDEPLSVKLKLHGDTGGRLRYALGTGECTAWLAHSEGVISEASEPAAVAPLDVQALWHKVTHNYSRTDVYTLLRRAGWEYGPSYQTIRRLGVGSDYCVAELVRCATDAPRLSLDPFMLDGALQTVLGFQAGKLTDGVRFLPLLIGTLRAYGPLPETGHAVVTRRTHVTAATGVDKFDVQLCGPDGKVLLRIKDFTLRAAAEAQPKAGDEARHRMLEALFRRVESQELGVEQARKLMDGLLKKHELGKQP